MSVTNFTCRLFGGRNVGVAYDSVAQTITVANVTVAGQAINISALAAAQQAAWANAIANSGGAATSSIASFGGDNIAQAIGNILDAQPVYRAAVLAALASVAG